jgi:hypothetical protein
MTVNALGHLGGSLYWGRAAPGMFSSPVLLASALALLVTTHRARHSG